MRKHFYYAIAFLLFLTVSCVSEKVETNEERTSHSPEAVWEYNGDNLVLKRVIQELKNGTNRESLERRLTKNDVLWENAEFIVIEGKKRILVPFLSIDKENIIGFFALYRDSKGKTQYDMIVRSDVYNKKIKLPFWDSSIWAGYFMAYDRTILGKHNGNPGVMRKAIPKEELKTMTSRSICFSVPYEVCVSAGGDCVSSSGEWSDYSCEGSSPFCTWYYRSECYDDGVPDNPIPDNPDPGSGGGSGGNPGGDGNLSIANAIENEIKNNLDPCPSEVYEKLKNATNNDIASILAKLGATNIYNVEMKMGAMQNPGDAAETSKISKNNYLITVSPDSYTTASKLYRATYLLHEIIHAYMLSVVDDYNTYPTNAPFTDFPELFNVYVKKIHPGNVSDAIKIAQHEDMATKYVEAIASALEEYQWNTTGIPSSSDKQIFSDMAWSGLQGTDVFNEKYPEGSAGRNRIKARIGAEQNGVYSQGQYAIGKPCN
jgi:hypothetical protein